MKVARLAVVLIFRASFTALGAVVVATPLSAQSAPRATSTLAKAELTELEAVRRAVWVNWFSGDTAALAKVLGPELVAMNSGVTNWQSRAETIAASAKFRAGGGKFVSIAFDSAMSHKVANAAVLFGRYTLITENKGERITRKGRLTEVFVKSNGVWVHTSWHLDADA